MNLILKSQHCRPNSSVIWFHETTEFETIAIDIIEDLVTAGEQQILTEAVLSEDALTLEYTITYTNWAAFEKQQPKSVMIEKHRAEYDTAQGITSTNTWSTTDWPGPIVLTSIYVFSQADQVAEFLSSISDHETLKPIEVSASTVTFVANINSIEDFNQHSQQFMDYLIQKLKPFQVGCQIKIEPV
jgi:hypothetical protein